ncbi:MAG: twin-arginine translocase subunit TatC [Desulfovibrio sp.]|nr:MAG: twin-arginine translocase subunit TatC [Desulfovibrio sp.]
MTFMSHMTELRIRMVRVFIAAMVGMVVAFFFKEDLFNILMAPLWVVLEPLGGHLQTTSLPEQFFTYLKVSLVTGILGTSPYIFYQFWGFISPGLYAEERKLLIPIAFCSGLFFTGGALFGYFIVFPFICDFFAGLSNEVITLTPKMSEYFSFSVKLLFAFGLVFELPLVIFFLSRLGLVTARWLRKNRKYAILLCFVTSAVLTPPDMISQLFMAGPLIVLYELSIWVAHFFGKKKKPSPDELDDMDEDEMEGAGA